MAGQTRKHHGSMIETLIKRGLIRRLFTILGFVVVAFSPQVTATDSAQSPLYFGVVPQQSASRLAITWQPIMDALSTTLLREVRFATATDIPAFEACLAAGAYDISYMNPYHYVVFHTESDYRAIGRQSDHKLRGVMVARKDGGIEELADLQDAVIAFPSPAAFGASVIPRAELRNAGISFTPRYVRSHDSVYQAVAKGLILAGGGVTRTWNAAPDAVKDELVIFYQTKPYTPHAFAISPDIDEALESQISQALYALGPTLLEPVKMKGIVAAMDDDWNDIRALNLDSSHTQITSSDSSQCRSN